MPPSAPDDRSPRLRSALRRATRNIALVPIVGAIFGFAASVLLARHFGADGRGYYAVTIALIMAFAQVASVGLGESLAIHESKSGAPSRPRLWLGLIWVLIAVAGFASCFIFPGNLLVVVGICISTCFIQGNSYALAAGHTSAWAVSQLIQPCAVMCAVVATYLTEVSIETVIAVYAISPVPACLICLAKLPSRTPGAPPLRSATRSVLKIGVQRQLTVTALSLVRRVDVLSLGAFASLAKVGSYAVAMSLVNLAVLLPWSLAGLILRDELRGGAQRRNSIVVRMSLLTLLPVGATVLFGWWLIPVVWGAEFQTSYVYFLLCVPGTLALGSTRALLAWRAGRGEQTAIVRRYLVLIVPTSLVIAFAALAFNAVGAAIGSSIAFILFAIAAYVNVPHQTDTRIDPSVSPINGDPDWNRANSSE